MPSFSPKPVTPLISLETHLEARTHGAAYTAAEAAALVSRGTCREARVVDTFGLRVVGVKPPAGRPATA